MKPSRIFSYFFGVNLNTISVLLNMSVFNDEVMNLFTYILLRRRPVNEVNKMICLEKRKY